MHSSTSSFERVQPAMPWLRVLGFAFLVLAATIAFMEWRLNELGYRPTQLNSEAKWAAERARANKLGKNALILVGQSRILLDVDLDALREASGMEPVQLAIDGNAPFDILRGLATDPGITGTIVVDYYDYTVGASGEASTQYQKYFEAHGRQTPLDAPNIWSENALESQLHQQLSSYADGANPFDSLSNRILQGKKAEQFLMTLPDRSVAADYEKVKMPDYYYNKVAEGLGLHFDKLPPDIDAVLSKKADTMSSMNNLPGVPALFAGKVNETKVVVEALKKHGAKVIFAAMPTSGLVTRIQNLQFPKSDFFDRFAAVVDAPSFRTDDEAMFAGFHCPDGSHLDYRDKPRFTRLLAKRLSMIP